MNMSRRDRQIQLRLSKISEASSPSPKREQKAQQLSSGRFNPLTLSASIATPKASPKLTPDRHAVMTKMQEEIMDRKRRLDGWQQASVSRSSEGRASRELVRRLARGIATISEEPEVKQTLLRAVKKGRKEVLRWLLAWIKQLFSMIRFTLIAQRSSRP